MKKATAKILERATCDVTVTVKRTAQIRQYEPLTCEMSITVHDIPCSSRQDVQDDLLKELDEKVSTYIDAAG